MSDIDCSKCPFPYPKRICKAKDGMHPNNCTTVICKTIIDEAADKYKEDELILKFSQEASRQEASCYRRDTKGNIYPLKPRIIEVIEFCKRMGYKKIGLAFCGGLTSESKVVGEIIRNNGFDLYSAICKVGGIDKSVIGLSYEDKIIKQNNHESMCNPIAQAMILNKAGTEFNILLGLCVGHDSLFIIYSEAMCTVLAVKDRVCGNNPLAPIYTSDSYYSSLKK